MYNNEFFLAAASNMGRYSDKPGEWGHDKYEAAYTLGLSFTTKDEYLAWVKAWKECYKFLTADRREARKRKEWPKHTRATRHAMMRLRMDGKRKSWELKQQVQASLASR